MDTDQHHVKKLENGFKGIETVYKTTAVLSSSVVYTKMHLGARLTGRDMYY